jgi:RNA polymerase sigma-70 factor (ECF subfamily)
MPELERPWSPAAPRVFATTQWSVVLAAGQRDPAPARRALEALCQAYWYPIYVYVRRKGYGSEDAQDLTQEFFSQLIAKEHVRLADRSKGKFRSFLLATLDHFLAREWSRAHRQKRGGKLKFISLDQQTPQERYRTEPEDGETPERCLLRRWALTVLTHTMDALARECEAGGKGVLFRETRWLLSGEREGASYAEMGRRLGMGEGALRVAVHRLRKRFGELLRNEIAQTVRGPEEVDEELHQLLLALSG